MTAQTKRLIAMWSGPRNISTALMRSWENRADTCVIDEPFYACYLRRTGLEHPGREAVLAAQPGDWRTVVHDLLHDAQQDCPIVYQKHMTHHIADDFELDWLDALDNCFLIREPRYMLASLLRVIPDAGLSDTGLVQQLRLFDQVCERNGRVPPVIDSADVLANPEIMLNQLCERLGLDFEAAMLHWPAGPRDSDGVWAPYWYASVEQSTGFAPVPSGEPDIPEHKRGVLEQCERLYARIRVHRLTGAN